MKPIAIFYHCLFYGGENNEILPAAYLVISQQMANLKQSGLLDAASFMLAGINGDEESRKLAGECLPAKAVKTFHGLQCKNENRTILELEKWLPLHGEWYVLYFHSKGATHPPGDDFTTIWRNCMTKHCIEHWQQCVSDLDAGYDCVGVHWMEPPATPESQYIFAGTFWWARAGYLLTLPSILDRDRIKLSGIDAPISRYEAEVWLGNGPQKPKIKDYHGPFWNPSKIDTCK